MDLLGRIGLEYPVVQAGMGGGAAGARLAAAVSAAGGLGTVGITAPARFAAHVDHAVRDAGGRPVAANLLAPFIRRAHVEACIRSGVALVVFHGGLPPRWVDMLRAARIPVFATVGTAGQARAALGAGVDGLVVQGSEAGGHLVGVEPVATALPKVLDAAGGAPVLAAGGVADAADVARLLDAGAAAAVAGTRFLLTDESDAHPGYKQRVAAADRTVATFLFGVGWPLLHRVVPNAATQRWCAADELGPGWLRRANEAGRVLGRVVPMAALDRLTMLQRPGVPLYTPGLPLAGMPDRVLDRAALYAGETVHRLHDIVPAAEALARLVPARRPPAQGGVVGGGR